MNDAPSSPALPRWARAVDLFTVALLVLVVQVWAFGRIDFGTWLRIGETWRLWLIIVAAACLRHYFVPHPSLPARIFGFVRRGVRDEAFRSTWPTTVTTRLAVLLVGYLGVVAVGFPPGTPPIRVSNNEAANLALRWDTGWYMQIALEGYRYEPNSVGQQNIAFFPGYPLAVRAAANLLGSQRIFGERELPPGMAMEQLQQRFLAAGLIVSLVAFGWGLMWLYRLARQHLDDSAARSALLLMSAYPFAVYFSAAYTEALMLLALAASFYLVGQQRWGPAAAFALLGGITRPNGFLLAGPLGVIVLKQLLEKRNAGAPQGELTRHAVIGLTVAALPAFGVGLYSLYIYSLTGDLLAWREAHTAWGRSYTGFPTLFTPVTLITEQGLVEYTTSQPIEALNAVAAIGAVVMIWPITTRLGLEYGLLMLLNIAPPMFFGGFLSMGRVTSLLFPMFFLTASVLSERQRQNLTVGFALLQGFTAILFFTWRRML